MIYEQFKKQTNKNLTFNLMGQSTQQAKCCIRLHPQHPNEFKAVLRVWQPNLTYQGLDPAMHRVLSTLNEGQLRPGVAQHVQRLLVKLAGWNPMGTQSERLSHKPKKKKTIKKTLPKIILFLLMPFLTSSSITFVSTRHIESMVSMCSGHSLDIFHLSNHTVERAPLIGVYGLGEKKRKVD